MKNNIDMYLVGGAVRDGLLGIQSKDLDYSVVVDPRLKMSADDAYAFMVDHLVDEGFKIFLDTPEYFTARARFPKGHVNEKIVGDFVLARKDGPYTDGRRPDYVSAGTLEDDLRRRDFTVNALARAEDGTLIDLFGGQEDLWSRRLRAVGDPKERLAEDALRAFRAIRFAVTKGLTIDSELDFAMHSVRVMKALEDNISAERIKDELHRCFAYDTMSTLGLLMNRYPDYIRLLEGKGIWLEPTMRQRPGTRQVKESRAENICFGMGAKK